MRTAPFVRRTSLGRLLVVAAIALMLAYQIRTPATLEMTSPDEEIYLTQGFYPPEETAGVTFRWTSGEAQVDLPGIGSGASLKLHLNLHEFRPAPLAPDPVILSLNGHEVTRFTPSTELAGYDFDLPAIADLRGEAILDIHSTTFIPGQSMPGSTDERSLGLFIDQLKLEYGAGLVIPPLIVWALLVLSVVATYGFAHVMNWRATMSLGLTGLVLAAEIIGVVIARAWLAHNSPWIAGTAISLYLIAFRLKKSTRVAPLPTSNFQPPTSNTQSPISRFGFILIVFLVWRIALVFVPIVGADVVGVRECCPEVLPKPLTSWHQAAFGDWYRWDAIWYGSIAQNGYQYFGQREASNVAFFPLFPIVDGLVHSVTTLPVEVSGPIVSTLLTLLACWLLYRLTLRETGDHSTANRSVVYWLAFPAAYYLAIGYSEATYVVCVLAAFLFAREGRWSWSGVAAFLAGLARLHGALLIVPLGYEYLRQRLRPDGQPTTTAHPVLDLKGIGVFGAPLGVLAFMGYLGLQFGKPLAYFEIQTLFFKGIRAEAFPTFPGTTFAHYFNGLLTNVPSTESVAVMGAMILLLLLTLEAWARLPRVYGVYMLTVALFSLTGGDLISMPRFVVPMFPGFMALALMGRRPWGDRVILIVPILLQGALALMFTKGYWIA